MNIPYVNKDEKPDPKMKRPVRIFSFKWVNKRYPGQYVTNKWRNQSYVEELWAKKHSQGLDPTPIKIDYIEEFLYQN